MRYGRPQPKSLSTSWWLERDGEELDVVLRGVYVPAEAATYDPVHGGYPGCNEDVEDVRAYRAGGLEVDLTDAEEETARERLMETARDLMEEAW